MGGDHLGSDVASPPVTSERTPPTLGALERTTLAEGVYQRLRAAITGGHLAPGTDLSQVSLAQEFGTSRGPIREALQRLHAERLVAATPYQQYTVPTLAPQKVAELLEIRRTLEVSLISSRVGTITSEELAQLRELNASLRGEHQEESWLASDRRFHRELCGPEAEGTAFVEEIRSRVQGYVHAVVGDATRRVQACAEHDEILDALERGDHAAIEIATRTHILSTRGIALQAIGPTLEEDLR